MDAVLITPEKDARARPRPLRAGPLSLLFDAGDLRYVKWGGREVFRRIYAAVRDPNWDTVPGVISDLEVREYDSGFHVSYLSTHRKGEVHFVWRADIQGDAEGSIRFTFDGEAKTTFRRNRIGFCVLHPIRECAGAVCRARYVDGTERELRFPDTIAAEQPVKWLQDLVGLAHEVAPGVWAEVEFEGERFETEDQRNWTDASFKTYGTPLRLPFPIQILAGTLVLQQVRLRVVDRSRPRSVGAAGRSGAIRALETREGSIATVRVLGDVTPLPALGLGVASHGRPLLPEEVNRLRGLRPTHLRVDLRLWEQDWPSQLARAAGECSQLGAKLEVALHLEATPLDGLCGAADALAALCEPPARVLVLHRNQKSTTPVALQAARTVLAGRLPGVPLGAGTDADLYQLNQQRPPSDADFIGWSMNPQVHAFDDTSIAETPEAAAHQVLSVRRYFPGKSLVVSPITLRPRFNPSATGPAAVVPSGDLPAQVDPRQRSIFGAAWTLAMLKAVAESGASSVTLYETTGWRGVMEGAAGSPIPDKFPSFPGEVFPLWHVLADIGEFAGGQVVRTEVSPALPVATLLLLLGQRRRLLVANLGPEPRRIRIEGLAELRLSRCLDASSRLPSTTQPDRFRTEILRAPAAQVDLGSWAVATLDT